MTYVINIDWLALHCHYLPTSAGNNDGHAFAPIKWEPAETDGSLLGAYPWRYKTADYGTRQFARLVLVSMPNEEGGWDDFAEVQADPHAGILNPRSVIVRFVNRVLYRPDFWELANRFLSDNNFDFKGISRIDICADFNDFCTMSPLALIEGFAAKKFRHVGRGVGALYFDHGLYKIESVTPGSKPIREYGVHYTGLSFGTHTSDARVYLYDKSKELREVKDKPYIRDTWTRVGLDVRHVWRLEISIKAEGCKFRCKQSGTIVKIDTTNAADGDELAKIYHTFVARLFSFVLNRRGITNITREPRIQLLPQVMHYDRGTIRNVSCSNKMQRMIIKALYQLGDLYRGAANIETADLAQSFAVNIAESTDLTEWMSNKVKEWERPTHL